MKYSPQAYVKESGEQLVLFTGVEGGGKGLE